MNHKQKEKLARKWRTPKEEANKVSNIDTHAWRGRAEARAKKEVKRMKYDSGGMGIGYPMGIKKGKRQSWLRRLFNFLFK